MGKCVSKQTSFLTIPDIDSEKFMHNTSSTTINNQEQKKSQQNDIHEKSKNNLSTEEQKVFICSDGSIKNNEIFSNSKTKSSTKSTENITIENTNNNKGQSESKKISKRLSAAATTTSTTTTAGPETKGTAMSFGFRKKLHTPKKKNLLQKENKDKINNKQDTIIIDTVDHHNYHNLNKIDDKYHSATVISNPGFIKTDEDVNSDKNGNSGPENNDKNDTKKIFQPRNVSLRRDLIVGSGGGGGGGVGGVGQQIVGSNIGIGIGTNNTSSGIGAYRNSRFGFRSTNTVRPASTGITPKMTDFDENLENNNSNSNNNNNNNNNNINFSDKRRSKSAHTGRALTSYRSNDQQMNEVKNSDLKIGSMAVNNYGNQQIKQQQQQQQQQRNISNANLRSHQIGECTTKGQCTVVNSGLHTNVIFRPTPQPAVSVSKFTLHTTSLPKPQYPVPISLTTVTNTTTSVAGAAVTNRPSTMDTKNAKQAVNNTRRGFSGPRDISNDSGISSLENTSYDNNNGGAGEGGGRNSPRKLNRGRPRNLEMVISERHKFEVRDLDDSLSCDSIEPLALPQLPSVFSSNNQTVPLSGLVRSNTVLSRESARTAASAAAAAIAQNLNETNHDKLNRSPSDSGSIEEEKLNRDRSTSEKSTKNPSLKDYNISSKNSSPGSSRASWCNAGESLAVKDCSSLSLSSSDDSKDQQNEKTLNAQDEDDLIYPTIANENSNISMSFTGTVPKYMDKGSQDKPIEKPVVLSEITETKFAEMAAAVDVLLDDETSPTDSLVSSTESDDILMKKSKKKANEEIQEKDIDEISPEIEACSPLSPGTPTHASNSLSLSDVGRDFLIDDEIADQPALLFSDKADGPESTPQRQSLTDTPTLRDADSIQKSPALSSRRSIMHAAIELSLRTPVSLRKAALMNRTESLDTLSPCESIASDDLMMDYECHSSLDSIDRMSHSLRSQNGSILQGLEETQIFSELENKGAEMIREWSNILKFPKSSSKENKTNPQLSTRTTPRLLNRSRLQPTQLNYGSDSPKSGDSLPRKPATRSSSSHLSSFRDPNSSSDDLMIHDKSFRNSMIQDVLYFKKQMMRLRRVLQETDTLNPFEMSNNGHFFTSCTGNKNGGNGVVGGSGGLDFIGSSDGKELTGNGNCGRDVDIGGGGDGCSLSSSSCIVDDPLQELADLRRQVVYLQGQVEDRDRTIRIQKNRIDKFELERNTSCTTSVSTSISEKECVNTATQTDRVRPLSIGPDGLARSKHTECTNFTTTHFPAITNASTTVMSSQSIPATTTITTNNQIIPSSRRHTVISTTFTNLNHHHHHHITIPQQIRRASIGWERLQYKPVKTTLIGDPNKDYQQSQIKNSASPLLPSSATSTPISSSSSSSKSSASSSIRNGATLTTMSPSSKKLPTVNDCDLLSNNNLNIKNNNNNNSAVIKNKNIDITNNIKCLKKQFENNKQQQQQQEQQQHQQFITEPNKCHQNRKKLNFDDVNGKHHNGHHHHHSHTVTIV